MRQKSKLEKKFLDEMGKDPGNWKGPVYFNRKDPRLIVPKFDPAMGWTFNFASPYSTISIAIVLIIVILSIVFK
jgi:uncharacterized membrane protein